MWKEHALAVLNEAVAYSFSTSGVSIANHHSLAASFATWYEEEKKTRGYCPANWKWIVPPSASSTTPLYLGGNKWTDYTLFPAYLYSPSWKKHLEQALSKNLLASGTWTPPTLGAAKHLRAAAPSRPSRCSFATRGCRVRRRRARLRRAPCSRASSTARL